MTKKDIIRNISRATDIREHDVKTVIEQFYTEIKSALKKNSKIELRGFGTFLMKSIKNKTGRDFQTNTHYRIPHSKKAIFIPGKDLQNIGKNASDKGES